MKQKLFLILIISALLGGCTKKELDLGVGTNYFAPFKSYQKGVVFKYYQHYIPTNKDASTSTNIQYRRYQFEEPDILYCDVLNAAFEVEIEDKYQLKEGKMTILESKSLSYGDTSLATIEDNLLLDWKNGNGRMKMTMDLKNNKTNIISSRQQHLISDTIIDGRSCKKVHWTNRYKILRTTDTIDYTSQGFTSYAKGIGILEELIITDKYQMHRELIEQMSIADFEKKKGEAKKRVAYIDSSQKIDTISNFKLCYDESSIGDYYNRAQMGQLNGGKGTWWRILEKDLNEKKLFQESGYLTYRFVLNCKGEAGWFTTEQADLKFNKKSFNPETVAHLLEIVSSQKDWLVTENNQGALDSYVYITFKLQDGKIIELLP